jgi:hypothetical protein
MALMLPRMLLLLLLWVEQGAGLLQLLEEMLPVAAGIHVCLQLC